MKIESMGNSPNKMKNNDIMGMMKKQEIGINKYFGMQMNSKSEKIIDKIKGPNAISKSKVEE
jgi:hypothetical protein